MERRQVKFLVNALYSRIAATQPVIFSSMSAATEASLFHLLPAAILFFLVLGAWDCCTDSRNCSVVWLAAIWQFCKEVVWEFSSILDFLVPRHVHTGPCIPLLKQNIKVQTNKKWDYCHVEGSRSRYEMNVSTTIGMIAISLCQDGRSIVQSPSFGARTVDTNVAGLLHLLHESPRVQFWNEKLQASTMRSLLTPEPKEMWQFPLAIPLRLLSCHHNFASAFLTQQISCMRKYQGERYGKIAKLINFSCISSAAKKHLAESTSHPPSTKKVRTTVLFTV